ncbi:MAG TPA: site-2 protease family protein [Gemmatimonadaceae bacterium]|nr:site-2 protease family protein [Gemmatimonadaceae bacterium]
MNDTLQNILFVAPILLFSVIAHEYAHGYAALKQGDDTALQLGRLTWNPVKHIDPFLTIIMPLVMGLASNWRVMLGGAKPVPVNPANYRNLKRGDIIVSLAGVATNLVIAVVCTALIALFGLLGRGAPGLHDTVSILQVMMIYGVMINLMLIMFNLLPLPPLDGSHVMKYLMPARLAVYYQQIGRYGFIILIVMLSVGRGFLEMWMKPATIATSMLLASVQSFVLPRALEFFR